MVKLLPALMAVSLLWVTPAVSVHAEDSSATESNALLVEQMSEHVFHIQVEISSYQLSSDEGELVVDCDLPGATRIQPDQGSFPAFFHVLELDDGRYVRIDDAEEDVETIKLGNGIVPDVSGVEEGVPLSAEIARLGKRAFLRLSISPFSYEESGKLTVRKSIEATLRVSEDEPAGSKSRSRSLESAPLTLFDDAFPVCPPPMAVGVTEGDGNPGDFVIRRSVTNDLAWRIEITTPGLYRITGNDLFQAGVPYFHRDASTLMMSVRDEVLPIWSSTNGPMLSSDWILFYAAAVDSLVTTQNVYWLTVEDQSPPVQTVDASLLGAVPLVTSSWHTVEYAPKNIYDFLYSPISNYNNFFTSYLGGGTTTVYTVSTPFPIRVGNFKLGYTLYGKNESIYGPPDRRTEFWVNAVEATKVFVDYHGESKVTGTSSVPAWVIGDPTTPVYVLQPLLPGVPGALKDLVSAYLESFKLCYQRWNGIYEWPYYFTGPTNQANVQLIGVVTTNVMLLDITDACAPREMINYALQWNGANWNLTFGNTSTTMRCYALYNKDWIPNVPSLELTRFRNLGSTSRQADYLVVAPDSFHEQIYRLLKHRFKNELTVQVASPEDVYNEFSYGVKDERAIRQYFGYAYHHYAAGSPEYALLVGSGTLDPFNHLGHNEPDIIPVKMGWSVESRTSIEQWFVTVDGSDYLADMKLGRIPVTTLTNLEHVVDKIISYEIAPTNSSWSEVALLVSDESTNGLNFKAFSDNNTYVHLENGGFSPIGGIIKAYLDDLSAANVRNAINTEIDLGLQFVNFIGHGSEEQWSLRDIWKVADADNRNNTAYPIFSIYTCQNGAFQGHERTLAEAIVLNENGGSACVAPAAFAINFNSEIMADGYYAALATNRVERLGEAMDEGFLRLWSYNPAARELLFYLVFGDPAQQVWGGATP